MVSLKRKRSSVAYQDNADSDVSFEDVSDPSEDEIDLSSALTGKKPKKAAQEKPAQDEDEDDEDDLQNMLRESILKRDVKEGTALLKKTKGRTKITKGEVGGGSFQSMGSCVYLYENSY